MLSSGSNPTAADRHDRVNYGQRLMDEVEQAATESCKGRLSVACNTASTSLFQRQSFHPCQRHIIVKPTTIARNLWVMMNHDYSMRSHINKLVQSCLYSLRQIRSIQRSLTFDAAVKLICSLIHSRVDYCNSLFAGLPAQSINRLQTILTASARLACSLHKYDHITPALRDRLH